MGGVAMKFMADKFVGGDTGKIEDFLLAANPEILQQLKLADIEFKRDMAKLGVDLEVIAAADRRDARAMAKEKGMRPQVILSVVYMVGYFSVIFMFMAGYIKVAPAHDVMFGTLLGVLTTAQVQIMNFWFGSSAGSKQKTDALTKDM